MTPRSGVIASYDYSSDSWMMSITYGTSERNSAGTGVSNPGNLMHTYDGNGRRTRVNGTLAVVNLPASASGNTFDEANGMPPLYRPDARL